MHGDANAEMGDGPLSIITMIEHNISFWREEIEEEGYCRTLVFHPKLPRSGAKEVSNAAYTGVSNKSKGLESVRLDSKRSASTTKSGKIHQEEQK
jgi:hypothetical protein